MLTIEVQPAAHYQDRVTIDDVQYLFRLDYYDRTSSWYLSISTNAGVALVTGRKLTVGWNPLVRDRDALLPTGAFYVSSTIDPVGRDGFDDGSASLVHFSDEEVDAMTSDLTTVEGITIEAAP